MLDMIDPQQPRVYAAELASGVDGETFPRLDECQGYVDSVLAGTIWRLRFPHVRTIEVRDGRGRDRGAALMGVHTGTIWLPSPTRFQRYIIHELAHLVQPRGSQPHGPEFCRLYLNGVRRLMGPSAGETLAGSFLAYEVQVDEVGTYQLARTPISFAALLVAGL